MPERQPWGRWTIAAVGIVLAGVIAFFAIALAIAWDNTADDAYITLRYARHLAEGFGVSWNPGEAPVEGYSNFLFVLLGAALIRLGGLADPMTWLKALGGAAAVGTLATTYALTLRSTEGANRPRTADGVSRAGGFEPIAHAAAAVAVTALVLHPGQAFWAVSGMETTVCQLLVVLASYLVITAAPHRSTRERPGTRSGGLGAIDRRLVAASVAVFGASITRPESPIVLAPLVAFVFLQNGSSNDQAGLSARAQRAATLILPFLVLYAPYTAWRLVTFGRWLPNSAACKAGFAGEAFILGKSFLASAAPLLALAALGLLLDRRRVHLVLLGTPACYLAVFTAVDPVMSHLDRHFLATLPLLAAAAALGVASLARKVLPERPRGWTGVLVPAATVLFGALAAPGTLAEVDRAVRLAHPLEDLRRELGSELDRALRPGDTYAIGDTGLVPFLTGGTVLDVYCLNCREATAEDIDRDPERLADWILGRSPRFVVLQTVAGASGRGVWPTDRALAGHPDLARRYVETRQFGGTEDPLRYVVYELRARASL